jgi:hypothetical protein
VQVNSAAAAAAAAAASVTSAALHRAAAAGKQEGHCKPKTHARPPSDSCMFMLV